MKAYTVELKRTSYVTLYLEAETQEQAEALAWVELENTLPIEDANWDVESIEETGAAQ